MHRSSETIGKIAAALAVAQRTLQNPERTLTAAIPPSPLQQNPRSFRYASLASGLDIVRKALGEQEIATIQSTSLDKESGLIRLNTVLAHSSGEWIASDWPVCATTEVVAPRNLGAALTYARRYSLFTLVGIAGEDDLDAQGLPGPRPALASTNDQGRSGDRAELVQPERSASSGDILISELASVETADDLTLWTLRRISARNALQAHDAQRVELEYAKRLEALEKQGASDAQSAKRRVDEVPMASVSPVQKTARHRSKQHLAYVAAQPCMICKQSPCDAHHLKFAQPRALGRKVSDEFTVPLCRRHHQDLHQNGNERAWWANAGLSPLEYARSLWSTTIASGASAAPGLSRANDPHASFD